MKQSPGATGGAARCASALVLVGSLVLSVSASAVHTQAASPSAKP